MNFPNNLLLFVLFILPFVHSTISPTCKPPQGREGSIHFIADPTDRQAFLSCKPFANSPSIGFWEHHFCPNDMHFEYSSQQCTANSLPPNMVREANDILQIAILNGTCARGEQCIGGTVCDPLYQRCLCPYGTMAVLETLSCVKIYPMSQQQQSINSPQHQFWRAAQIRPSSSPYRPISQMIPVPPGSYCERGQQCGGGSICMRSIGGGAICACPIHFEQHSGQCHPIKSTMGGGGQTAKEMIGQGGFFKVPLGEQCNEYLGLFCADQSAICGNGLCRCVPPMSEKDGHCQMITMGPSTKEAGPGEPCNAGQICIRGSVCNRRIPICVCPQGTDLHRGWCVDGRRESSSISPIMIPIGSAEKTNAAGEMLKARQKEANVGEKCSLNADCSSGAYCNGNTQPPTCQCLSTHVNVHQHCEKVIYPGQRGCETDLQCSAAYAGARCVNSGQCICPPGSTVIDQTCIPAVAWPGEACNISRLMPVCSADSYCFEGHCICNPPLSLFQKQCIQRREETTSILKRECSKHFGCPKGSHCSAEGRCEFCGKEQTRLAGNCVHLENFGGKFGSEFLQNDGEMKNGTQIEKIESTAKKTMPKMNGIEQIFAALSMLRKAALDGIISRKTNSTLASFGRRERRETIATKMERKKEEIMRKRVAYDELPHGHRMEGEPCSPGNICLNGTVCEDGKCKCPNGKCNLSPTYRQIGSQCRNGVDRCIGGSQCLNSNCTCTDGAIPDLEIARCRQMPGGRCSAGQFCGGHSECRLGICRCRIGLKLEEERKKCIRAEALPGQNCESGEKCVGGSKCGFGQICLCPPNQIIVANGTKCEKKSEEKIIKKEQKNRKNKLLLEDDPEGEENGIMDGNGNTARGGLVRLVTARPGQRCSHGETCIGGSICRFGRCSCVPSEYLPEGSHHCVKEGMEMASQKLDRLVAPGPGQLCTKGGALCVGDSKCLNGICQCPEGYNLFRDECLPPRAKMSPEKFRAQSVLFSPDFAVMDSPQSSTEGQSMATIGGNENMQDPVPNRIVASGAMCRLSLECPYRTTCLRGVCRCQKGETIVNGVCRKTIHEVLPGGRCDTQKGLDCVGESHCFYGICVCLYGLVIVGHECANSDVLKTVPPGGLCAPKQQCHGRARCIRGKCQCPRGHRIDSSGEKRCIKSIRIPPSTPSPKPETMPAHSEADSSDPSAATSFIPLQPIPKFIYTIPAALAAAAEDGKFNQILTANQMSFFVDQEMLRTLLAPLVQARKIGTKNPLLAVEGTMNGEKGCEGSSCLVTSPPVTTVDSPPTPSPQLTAQLFSTTEDPSLGIPGHSCTSNHLCHGGALCLGGICVCRPGFRPLDGFCQIAKVGLGEQCFINEQCNSHGFCIDGICRCSSDSPNPLPQSHQGRRLSFHRHRCPIRPVATVGEDCSQAQSCTWNSVCGSFSGVCECAVGLERSQGACIAAHRPRGVECLSSSNCHKNSFCDNGYCICKSEHAPVAGFCLPPARPVVDDPKAYVDPNLMAILLRKQGIGQTINNNVKMEVNNPFGLRMSKMGTNGGENVENEWREQPWQNDQQQKGNTLTKAAIGLGWPFSNGITHFGPQNDEEIGDDVPLLELGPQFAPEIIKEDDRRMNKAKGTKTMSLEEKKELLMRTSAGKGRQGKIRMPNQRKERIAMPGEFCGNNARICLGNSICLSGWCQCPDGIHVEKGGMCALGTMEKGGTNKTTMEIPSLPSNGLSHSPMKFHGREPHKPWESCANGPCIHGANCIRSSALNTVQKLGPFCQCAPGTIFIDGECVPRNPEMRILPIGSHCPQPSICDFGAFCGPKGICQCAEGQKPIAGICVQIALPGESCAHGEFCADGAVCAPGLDACVCPVGWKVRQGRCHRGRKMMAKLAQREKKRKRQKVIKEGGEGEDEIMFTEMPPNSAEATKMTTMAVSPSTTTIMPMPHILVPLGEICHSDKDCRGVSKAYCAFPSRRCTCIPGYAQLYSSICVPEERIRFPGEECVASAHFCSANSWCKDGQCQCFQRDMLALNGRCQRVHLPGEMISPARTLRRHPQKLVQESAKWCLSELDCPAGTKCRDGECLCNGLSLAQAMFINGAKNWAEEQECSLDLDCPPILGCHQGRCVCIRISLEKPLPSSTHLKREELEGKEADDNIEFDYALGEPVGPILPGTFCDAFSRCGPGAECFFGKCQCIFKGQKLAFVNGMTECVYVKLKKGEKEFAMNEDGKMLNLIRYDCTNKTLDKCKREKRHIRADQIKSSNRILPDQNCNKSLADGKCQHSTGPIKGPFQSETLSSNTMGGNFQNAPTRQTTPISQKLAIPGKQCGPLDICTGGSSCVEGFCLCPAGTRPSPLGGNCETFEQRKVEEEEMATTSSNKDLRSAVDIGISQTAPVPIKSNKASLLLPPTNVVPPQSPLPSPFNPSSTPIPPLIANQPNFSAIVDPPSTSTLPAEIMNCSNKNCLPNNNYIPLIRNLINMKGPRRAPQRRPYSRPSESCENGEICTGGSTCQQQTKICECPPRKPILRNHICIQSSEMKGSRAKPGEKCNSETICIGDSICTEGHCLCQNGFVLEGSKCVKEGENNVKVTGQRSSGMVPPPNEALPPVKLAAESETTQSVNEQEEKREGGESDSDSSTQTRSNQKPRISGPPLRKSSSIGGSSSSSSINRPLAPEGSTGVCPPGNVPTTDPSTGQLLVCNGMTPNCPPKSYCFITVKIFALPGQSCLEGQICLGGALCDWADRKCVCVAGHIIMNGFCTINETIGEQIRRREKGDYVSGSTKQSTIKNKWPQFLDEPRRRAKPCPLPEHPEKCQLPDCFCSKDGQSSPLGDAFPIHQIPQFVVLTFDDAVNGRTMRDYFALFGSSHQFRNLNGCPVKATFFVSHEWTDYNEVERIANSGHEIASNSITHECLRKADGRRWLEEMSGQREILSAFGNVPPEKIVGLRAPQLNLGGDHQFQAMVASNFLYDNSFSIDPIIGPPFWPQTLDFRLAWPCDEESNCQESSFPSIWEIPLNQFHSPNEPQRSAMLRGAIEANASVEAIQILLQLHFQRSFSTNRAPLVLSLNADFLQIGRNRGIRALINFINILIDHYFGEVYFVTLRQLVEWMRRPLPLNEMHKFPWTQCDNGEQQQKDHSGGNKLTCERPNKCIYPTPELASPEHQMLTCSSPCPMMFPWVGNPLGTFTEE